MWTSPFGEDTGVKQVGIVCIFFVFVYLFIHFFLKSLVHFTVIFAIDVMVRDGLIFQHWHIGTFFSIANMLIPEKVPISHVAQKGT